MSKSETSSRSSSADLPEEDADNESSQDNDAIAEECENGDSFPSSPPPPYERVLDEESSVDKPHYTQEEVTTPEAGPKIFHKSSKELYKAVAKQFGITCKMSDQCRCLDCQSHYFDCEYEQNENNKSDGGLGAGSPMFISEVMHGTACVLL
ncbi:uncharacterized protein LOC108739415 [Agrilus planipennis]|uniref:Uncharacterized protein LOC108739415 n=1 Tax=Agrilus planipennis TaxID=224129 RepID=A0A1W4X8T1_AGRPL|nr:uncharacterized protein LOC108739415 [Agrilus planipennis]